MLKILFNPGEIWFWIGVCFISFFFFLLVFRKNVSMAVITGWGCFVPILVFLAMVSHSCQHNQNYWTCFLYKDYTDEILKYPIFNFYVSFVISLAFLILYFIYNFFLNSKSIYQKIEDELRIFVVVFVIFLTIVPLMFMALMSAADI